MLLLQATVKQILWSLDRYEERNELGMREVTVNVMDQLHVLHQLQLKLAQREPSYPDSTRYNISGDSDWSGCTQMLCDILTYKNAQDIPS